MISDYKDKHDHQGCFIIGNGPSLRDVIQEIDQGLPTFGTNRIYLSGHVPTYYVCVNPLVLSQFHDEIAELDTTKFIPKHLPFKNQKGTVIWIDTTLDIPAFSNPEGPIWEGHTVTYVCLQLAYYMGFHNVYLVGVDHDYGDYKRPNLELVSTGPDQNHFDPSYFGRGIRWHAPDLARSEMAYSLAKRQFELDGRTVFNASTHSKLTVFPHKPFPAIWDGEYRLSVIVSAYKGAKYLPGLIDDLAAQTMPMKEIIWVYQKGSPEEEIIDQHWGIKIATDDVPTIYKAWNMAIRRARGRYITNANCDDRHHPMAYEIMCNLLDARPDIDLVYHDSYVTWVPNQTYEQFEQQTGEKLVVGREQDKPGIMAWPDYDRGMLTEGCFMGPQPMWRASLHQRYGLFAEQYKSAGDYEFWLRVARDANMMHIGHPLGLYLARMDGVELSNPMLSMDEASSALLLNQNPEGASISIQGPYLRIRLGGDYTYADPNDVIEALQKMVKDAHVPVPMS